MQPIQIGMNSALVLIILLLAVPLQLFLSHYINTTYAASVNADSAASGAESVGSESIGSAGMDVGGGIDSVRIKAFHRLSSGVAGVVGYVQNAFQHYSKWDNIKELFVIPYKRGHFKSTGKLFPESTSKFITPGTIKTTKSTRTRQTQGSTTKTGGKAAVASAVPNSGAKAKGSSKSTPNTKTESNPEEKTHSKPHKTMKEEEYLYQEVYFAHSSDPRVVRPPQVKLKVGQLVQHKQDGYIGVIVGWDEVAKAPEEWLKKYYFKRMDVAKSPHYLVLIDSRYSPSANPFHYLPQEDLQVLKTNTPVQAPEVNDYFEGFRNHRHLLRPWLQKLYPNDSN